MQSKNYEPSDRESLLQRAADPGAIWDFIIIGGGATGAGIALDASLRGFKVLLLEAYDFGKGTSSRSTKLVHGGVRYLEQFQIHMVKESLRERGRLLANAPSIVHELEFIIPCTRWFDRFFYGAGLKVYDFLAVGSKAKRSAQVSKGSLYGRMPNLKKGKFVGGVSYSDGQFDDSRLLIEIVRSAASPQTVCLNYAKVTGLIKSDTGKVEGVRFQDTESRGLESGAEISACGRVVINATGPFCDSIRSMDDPTQRPLVAASQGVHLVVSADYFPASSAFIVPKTSDGRVLFVIPWHGHVLVGTTDTAIEAVSNEPRAFPEEIQFLLATLADYCGAAPTPDQCLSVFTGIRPLVKGDASQATKKLSRDHTIEIGSSDLLTITGGKWTTYRQMAEDCVDQAIEHFGLPKSPCETANFELKTISQPLNLERSYDWPLSPDCSLYNVISLSDLVRGIRYEFARTVEDLLARRTRALFLNVREARMLAPLAAQLLADELQKDQTWVQWQVQQFDEVAQSYDPKSFL